jgi:hypothetical protein
MLLTLGDGMQRWGKNYNFPQTPSSVTYLEVHSVWQPVMNCSYVLHAHTNTDRCILRYRWGLTPTWQNKFIFYTSLCNLIFSVHNTLPKIRITIDAYFISVCFLCKNERDELFWFLYHTCIIEVIYQPFKK